MTTRREVLQMTAAAAMTLPMISTDSTRIFATESEPPAPLITPETSSELILMGTMVLPNSGLDPLSDFRTFRLAGRTGRSCKHELLASGFLDRSAPIGDQRELVPFDLTAGQLEQVQFAMWTLDRLLKPLMFR